MNQALVLVKPHANFPDFVDDVEQILQSLTKVEKRFTVKTTKEQADKHYRDISERALESREGSSIVSAAQYLEQHPNKKDLALQWRRAEQITIEKNFYIAKVDRIWVANGFYPLMQDDFDGGEATVFVVRFDYKFARFKNEVIGATDSSKAMEGSIRHLYHKKYRPAGVDLSHNGVHASAGAIEGVRDLALWAGIHFTETLLYENPVIRYAMENKEIPSEFDTYDTDQLEKAVKDLW